MLNEIALFLAAAVIFVPLFRRSGLGAVLGYLCAGMLIGPWGLGLISEVEKILHVSELGVVLLLFIIGLELQPSRLWALRRTVFGVGGAQVFITTLLLMAVAWMCGLSPVVALVAGFGLAMSSTAFVLQMLAERHELAAHHGRLAFAVLLFQDISVIPFLALVPLLGAQSMSAESNDFAMDAAKVVAMLVVVLFSSRYLIRPLFRLVAAAKMPEVFTAAALLTVLATALAMQAVGLSMSLGAFLAGVLLADSEYRHELQANIEPFKGLLLGLFFMAVGMSAELVLLLSSPWLVIGLATGLMFIKGLVLFVLGRWQGLSADSSRALAFALPQGGEFAFVLFAIAASAGILDERLQALLVLTVTLSMMLTPPLYALQARFKKVEAARPYDAIEVAENPVIIAGFGPFGQVIGRILRVKKIPFTVLEKDFDQVDFVRRFGSQVFYGDATRLDLLRAAHTDKARLFVVATTDQAASLEIASMVRKHFPGLRIFAVARTRTHALRLMDLGIKDVIRRSYFSSLEMTRELLTALGESPESASRVIRLFRENDEKTLAQQQKHSNDEKALIQSAQQSARELEQLFEQDAEAVLRK